MIILKEKKKYTEYKFMLESDFEAEIVSAKELIFGKNTIYIDTKKKIGSHSLGNTVPDGFLFDMSDAENHEFYLVEVELEKHDFFNHIFPQITKFFAFYKNKEKQKELVEKLFSIINSDKNLKKQFKKQLGDQEIYKYLSDLVDASQNILLIIDGEKPELPEITDTYSDTWGKMVRLMVIKKLINKSESMLHIHPEFENIEISLDETPVQAERKANIYTEEHNLEGVESNVKQIYKYLKSKVGKINSSYILNPQKYYISIKGERNVAFLKFRKKKIRMVAMMPEDDIRAMIKNHPVKSLSEPVQKFYNGPCAAIDIDSLEGFDEIVALLRALMKNKG